MDAVAQQIETLLATPESPGWVSEFARVLYDSAEKSRLVGTIRDSVASQITSLPEADRSSILGGVVSALARRARLVAPARTTKAFASLSGADLDDRIIEAYPTPIAIPYRAMTEETDEVGKFGCLLDTFEATIHFLATVVVSAYLRTDLSKVSCNRILLPQLLRGKWSVGQIMGLLRDMVREARDCAGQLPYAELPSYLFGRNGKPTEGLESLQAFVELRNREWGHLAGRTGKYFAGLYGKVRPDLDDALAHMPWLADWHLIRPVQINAGNQVIRADLLIGERPRLNRGNVQPQLRPDDLQVEGGDIRIDRDALLLVSADQKRYLPLFPLSLITGKQQTTFFLQNPEWKQEAHSLRLTRVEYVAYKADCARHLEEHGDPPATCLEKHADRLRRKSPDALPTSSAAAPVADPDFSLSEVRNEQQSHLRHFVGRSATLQEMADWIDCKAEGGYLLLLGPPGQGKSALMAELARREGERGGCLLHMVKSHRSPLRFLPSLISQATQLAETNFGADAYRGDIDDLRNCFVRSLAALRNARGRAVVVLDALDELPANTPLTFLPPHLPEGVRVVLSCRPDIPLVIALQNRLHEHHEIREMPMLVEADFRELLERRLDAGVRDRIGRVVDYTAVFRHLGGHPLFLHHFIDRVRERWDTAARAGQPFRFEVDELPTTSEAYFRDVYNRVRLRTASGVVSAEGRIQERLLHLLCIARESLRLEELADLLAADSLPLILGECRDRVEAISQYLLDTGNGRYRPFHQGLTDYVRSRELGVVGVAQVEDVFRQWLDLPQQKCNLYALRNGIDHRLAAGDVEGAVGRLTDWRYLEAKTEAGLVLGLAADFRATLSKLEREHPWYRRLELLCEALRREGAFLQFRPTCLFQQLWNLGWWYDHPEAARCYYLGQSKNCALLPWARAEPKLYDWFETWRKQKEQAQPGFVWLRSLGAPVSKLESQLKAVLHGHEGSLTRVVWSPDGSVVASGSQDKTLRVWDVATGTERFCLRGHDSWVTDISWSLDGTALASGSVDETVRVWDPASGTERFCLSGHQGQVGSVAWSPDSTTLASGSYDKTVRVWDAVTGTERFCLRGHKDHVVYVVWSPDGTALASESVDLTVRVWDAVAGTERCCFRGHESWVGGISWSPDGKTLASASDDKTVRIWDATTGVENICLRGHEDIVNRVTWSPDGKTLASGSDDKTIRLWDAANGVERLCLRGHETVVNRVAWSPDGMTLASGSWDQTVRVWDAASGAERLCLRGHGALICSIAWSPDGTAMASGSGDKTIRLWDTVGEAERLDLRGHQDKVNEIVWSRDGSALASMSSDRTVRVWDPANGAERHCLRWHDDEVSSVAWSPDGTILASASFDQMVRVWDPVRGTECFCLRGHEKWVGGVTWSPDGAALASRSADMTVRVWDPALGTERFCLRGHLDIVNCVAWSPDGTALASGSFDLTVRVWDAATGTERYCLRGHESGVIHLAWSPDGTALASGSRDKTIRVWDVASGSERLCLRAHQDWVTRIAWSPDGTTLVSESKDKTVRVWQVTTGDCLRVYTQRTFESVVQPFRSHFNYFVSCDNTELVIRLMDDSALAWVCPPISCGKFDGSGRRLAGAVGNHVVMYAIEGDLPVS